jgi:thiol-disulfide isomerase/thioredoxin
MSNDLTPRASSARRLWTRLLLAFGLPLVVGLAVYAVSKGPSATQPAQAADPAPTKVAEPSATPIKESPQPQPADPTPAQDEPRRERRQRAPELDGGVAWLNTAGPIRLNPDLRGKVVILDFWTLCCINCIHTLPDLAKLEKKYPNQLVVIGVHSAKFYNERSTASIRKAILRYEISHPVINDANMALWMRYGVHGWPTLVLIDPEGYYYGSASGEGLYEVFDREIDKLIKEHRAKKTLNEEPLRFDLARFRERGDSPLFFPGKVLADSASGRLFISDSTHHRIVLTDLDGKKIAIAGTGEADKKDGPFAKACFNDPQGLALRGETLYVADRRNHLIRALDLKKQTVTTIAGSGEKGEDRRQSGPALRIGLNSPWDLVLHGDQLYIAMAGHHQIWVLDLNGEGTLAPYAGNGREDIMDGGLQVALFAQPSGLATDGTTLWVADSEVSAIRAVPLGGQGQVKTVVGEGLFEFDDKDGVGDRVRLQHPLGVAYHDGKVYVADTYNSKIKILDPVKRSCTTYLGGKAEGWLTQPLFNEPAGLSFAGDKLYVADTNNHRIRVIDLKTKAVSTLKLTGVEPPKLPAENDHVVFPNPQRTTLPTATVPADGELTLEVELRLPAGCKLNPEAAMTYRVETLPESKVEWSETKKLAEAAKSFKVTVPAAKVAGAKGLSLSVVYYECSQSGQGVCRIKSQIWELPLKFDAASTRRVIQMAGPAVAKNGSKTE